MLRAPRRPEVVITAPFAFAIVAFAALGAGPACGSSSPDASVMGSGGRAPTGPLTSVDVEVSGQGTVTVKGDPAESPVVCAANAPCHADLHGTLTLTAKADDGNVFLDYVDPASGTVLGNKPDYTIKSGTTASLRAVFSPLGQGGSGAGGGGSCTGDACGTAIATKLSSAAALALSPTDVYFLGSVEKVARKGGAPTTIFPGTVSVFAIDDKYAYLIDGTGTKIKRVALDGSETKDIGTADGTQHPQAIAVDDTWVYYTTQTPDQHCTGVLKTYKDGSLQVPQKVASACDQGNTVAPFGLAIDGSYVYWSSVVTPGFTQGTVFRAQKNLAQAEGEQIALGSSSASKLRVHGTTLYWLQDGVMMADLTQCNPCQAGHAVKTQGVADFQVDDAFVYAVGDGGLVKADMKTLVETKLSPTAGQSLVMDDKAFFWAGGAPGNAAIYTLAK
jgi:hypothetical protein